jgi:thioredoxin reductase
MDNKFDVIIIGGSFSGLAAGMGLGRALRRALIIDSGLAANRYTPESHNFLTQDGQRPAQIASIAKQQVDEYNSVRRINGNVVKVERSGGEFFVFLSDGTTYRGVKLIFATGIVDLWPNIPGFGECWGKSVLHCPYCHGYEVKNTSTGILANGDNAFDFASLISNWTKDLTIYTNGTSTLTVQQTSKLHSHNIRIVQDPIEFLIHNNGYIEEIAFTNGHTANVKSLYARPEFKQHCDIPITLGCEITTDGYIQVDPSQRTTIPGVYACGDNVTRLRTIANAVSMGTATAITLNKDMILESF